MASLQCCLCLPYLSQILQTQVSCVCRLHPLRQPAGMEPSRASLVPLTHLFFLSLLLPFPLISPSVLSPPA